MEDAGKGESFWEMRGTGAPQRPTSIPRSGDVIKTREQAGLGSPRLSDTSSHSLRTAEPRRDLRRLQIPLPAFHTQTLRPGWGGWQCSSQVCTRAGGQWDNQDGSATAASQPRNLPLCPLLPAPSPPASCGVPATIPALCQGQQDHPLPRAHPASWPQPFSLDRNRQWGACLAEEIGSSVNHAFRALCDAEMKDV